MLTTTKTAKINISINKQDLVCPILNKIMTDPVLAPDGYTYQRESIAYWFNKGNRKSPLTGKTLLNSILIDNLFAQVILKEAKIAVTPDSEMLHKQQQVGITSFSEIKQCVEEKENFIHKLYQETISLEDRFSVEKNCFCNSENANLKNLIEHLTKQITDMENSHLCEIKILEERIRILLSELDSLKRNQQQEELFSKTQIFLKPKPKNAEKAASSQQIKHIMIPNNAANNNIKSLLPIPIQSLKVNTSWVYSLIEASENLIASGSGEKSITLWKRETDAGKFSEFQTLEGHANLVLCLLQVSENFIASGSADMTIKLWKKDENASVGAAGKYKEVQTLEGHTDRVWSLIKVTENLIASGSYDNTIKLWKKDENAFGAGKFKEVQTLKGHTDRVLSLVKLSDNLIASGSCDKTIILWREVNGKFKEVQTLTSHTNTVYSLGKISDSVFASGSGDKTIILWRESNDGKFEEIQTLLGHTNTIYSLVKVSDNVFASGSYQSMKVWRDYKGKFEEIQNIAAHSGSVYSLLKLSDNIVVSGSYDSTIKLWNL